MSEKTNIVERIAPRGVKNVLAGSLALAGLVLVFGLTIVDGSLDRSVRVGALGASGVLLFIGSLWDAQLRYGGPRAVDERETQIYYRASWATLLGLVATWVTLSVGLREDIVSLSSTEVLTVVTVLLFGIFFITQWIYRWLM